MKEQKLYVCEYCHTQYKDKNKAIQCEKNHHFPMSFKDYKYHAAKDSQSGYPDWVEIIFEDGKCLRYHR